jgi:hypothetical protein
VREKFHIAFKVKNLEEASKGLKVLLGPFVAEDLCKAGFYETEDGLIWD